MPGQAQRCSSYNQRKHCNLLEGLEEAWVEALVVEWEEGSVEGLAVITSKMHVLD